jgi:hypothetical protein
MMELFQNSLYGLLGSAIDDLHQENERLRDELNKYRVQFRHNGSKEEVLLEKVRTATTVEDREREMGILCHWAGIGNLSLTVYDYMRLRDYMRIELPRRPQ